MAAAGDANAVQRSAAATAVTDAGAKFEAARAAAVQAGAVATEEARRRNLPEEADDALADSMGGLPPAVANQVRRRMRLKQAQKAQGGQGEFEEIPTVAADPTPPLQKVRPNPNPSPRPSPNPNPSPNPSPNLSPNPNPTPPLPQQKPQTKPPPIASAFERVYEATNGVKP